MAPLPEFSSGLLILSAHTSLQTKMHKHYTKAVILTAQCQTHLIYVLKITLLYI